jgi:tRNA A37 threonylcarbamoyladenosine dehydratase
MEERYSRNRIYVSENEQSAIKNTRLFLGGAGIGSVIAECALRFGFENITVVDGDKVELSNLNRQNYTEAETGKYKAGILAEKNNWRIREGKRTVLSASAFRCIMDCSRFVRKCHVSYCNRSSV